MPKVIDTDRLFRATVKLFTMNGYAATTTQEIARQAGVNEATIYRRYGSKPELIKEALRHCLAHSPFADLNASDDVTADLLAIVAAYEKTYQSFGGAVMTLMIEMPRHDELKAASTALIPNFLKAEQIIALHQESGALKPGHPAHTLLILISPIMASGMMDRSTANFDIPAFSAQQIVDGFLKGHQSDR